MKLKYKKTVKRHFYRNEKDYRTLLTKGKEYVVLGISFSDKNRYVCLETNDELPALLDIRQFEVVSNYVPSRWTVRYTEASGQISFFPQSWAESESFWTGLFKKQEHEMFRLYQWERNLIFEEEPS
ncbi:MAG TPA: hypothetical protein VNK03_06800 [Gammaproteobacteria bacterium]|nr:hypothetical protein [Gammaproteobacteria bacterium]